MKRDEGKTREQLMGELEEIRQQLAQPEASEVKQKQAGELFRSLAMSSPVGVYIVQGREFQYVNPAFQKDTGYSEDELLGTDSLGLVVPEDRDMVRENAVKMLKGQQFQPYEYRSINKVGDIRWVLETVAPITYQGKQATVGTYVDITERKQGEILLQESEEQYRDLFDNTSELIQAVTPDGNFLYVNKAWNNTLGYSEEDVADLTLWNIIHPDSIPHCMEIFQKVISGEPVYDIEANFVAKDGRIVSVKGSASCRFEEGKPVYTRGIFSDISERRKAEEKERQLQEELHLASRLATVGQMSSGIAHEINNPLTGVIGFSDLLLKKDLPDDIKKDVEVIHNGAKRIASITERMLAFARQRKPERGSVNINDIIETTLAMRTYEMESSNIKLTTQLAPDIPFTFADAGQMQQVFLNIILNAEMEMKLARGKGSLSIKTERIDNTIRVSFKDDGPGIPKKNLDRLFDPFFTTRDPDKGTGLGLSISYSIVTQHGGKIYARSRLGKGATFFVELPIVTQAEQLELAAPILDEPKKISGARILVVDDEPIVQQFLTKILSEEGHGVEIIDNGDDALERLGSEDYDAILLDIKLPGMSGIDLHRHMQESIESLSRRVIFITGDVMSRDTTAFLSRTRVPCITKPFDTEGLKKAVHRILANRG